MGFEFIIFAPTMGIMPFCAHTGATASLELHVRDT